MVVVTIARGLVKMNCIKCGGSGWIRNFKYVEGGKCFKCEGKGYILNDNTVLVEYFDKSGKLLERVFFGIEPKKSEAVRIGKELGAHKMTAKRKVK